MYNVGDKLIHTRHGTDHTYEEVYTIKDIKDDMLLLRGQSDNEFRMHRELLDQQLHSDYPQFQVVPKPIVVTYNVGDLSFRTKTDAQAYIMARDTYANATDLMTAQSAEWDMAKLTKDTEQSFDEELFTI